MSVILLLVVMLAAARVEAADYDGTKPCTYPADILLIVDGSSTVCGNDIKTCKGWDYYRQFMHKLVDGLSIGFDQTRVGLVKYGDVVTAEWNLTKYLDKPSLLEAIDNLQIPMGELTYILTSHVVVSKVYNKLAGDRLSAPNIAIVITDGMPKYDPHMTGLFSTLFQLTGVKFLVVCVTPGCDDDTARLIASPPKSATDKTYYFVDGSSAIDSIREPLLSSICFMAENCYKRSFLGALGLADVCLFG